MIIRRLREFHTNFGLAENPLSDGGRWKTGLAHGLDWTDMQTSGSVAYGTMTFHAHPPYDDSVALWTPPDGQMWRDMEVEAQVYLGNRGAWTGSHELELWLCGQVRANYCAGYEMLFSANEGVTYTEIVRWNGALNSFTSLTSGAVFNLSLDNGDWIKATKVGPLLTLYHRTAAGGSYTQKGQVSDSTFVEGYPGYGHWLNGAGNNNEFGLTSFRARSL